MKVLQARKSGRVLSRRSLWSCKIKTRLPGLLPFSWAHIFPSSISTHQSLLHSPRFLPFFFASYHSLCASPCAIQLHCSSPPLCFHTLLIISLALSLFHCGIRAPQRCRDVWNHWRSVPEAAASHSCGTSATSQPSTTDYDPPRPRDLRARIGRVANLNIKTKSYRPKIQSCQSKSACVF